MAAFTGDVSMSFAEAIKCVCIFRKALVGGQQRRRGGNGGSVSLAQAERPK
jgi:hypothetical protein